MKIVYQVGFCSLSSTNTAVHMSVLFETKRRGSFPLQGLRRLVMWFKTLFIDATWNALLKIHICSLTAHSCSLLDYHLHDEQIGKSKSCGLINNHYDSIRVTVSLRHRATSNQLSVNLNTYS